ncbi:hypothetical protein DPMN_129227 [Dreissena polymorpha]|uniref:Uncharacterized protein n=1 Tax=Dreissena polymorpha TaxID=45954 RepID=A0A9D4H0U3_DREPO|nr:hypothetical protein DPMN_129227 [Dreissena polymorpha]
MTSVRQYEGDEAIERRRQCDNAIVRNTMTTVRQFDDDSATIQWRQCDSTIATMRKCDSA